MEIQQRPCIAADKGFEYKIAMIQLATRFKHSPDSLTTNNSNHCLGFQAWAGCDTPFFGIWTDNAMNFTMQYTPYADRKTAFTKAVETSERLHALIPKGKPWRNGFIERSNRTDNEEFFNRFPFTSSQQRKY